MEEQYAQIEARYYDDQYAAKQDLADLPFYLELAEQQGGPVLEIGCGTGRVLLELARRGLEVDGLDLSNDQLAVLHSKLEQLPREVRQRVRIHRSDMRSYELLKEFKLILIPFRPLQHMYTLDDQIAALTAARRHLQPKGLLAFDVFYPIFSMLEEQLGEEVDQLEWPHPEQPGWTIKRSFLRRSVNRLEQYFEGEFIYRTFDSERLVKEERCALKMNYYTYPHLRLLLRHCGLEVVSEYGSFDKQPISVCREMIFVVRRTD